MSFKSSLRMGDIGEYLFYQAHCGSLNKLDGKHGDFELKATGEKLELKTDLWDLTATPNFFFERWSDVDNKRPGGPWQAKAHGCRWFVYFHPRNLTYFRFETTALVKSLEKITPTLTPTEVANRTWTTVGYRVPRALLKDLYEEFVLDVTLRESPDDTV